METFLVVYGIIFLFSLGMCFIAKSLPSPVPLEWQWLVMDEPRSRSPRR